MSIETLDYDGNSGNNLLADIENHIERTFQKLEVSPVFCGEVALKEGTLSASISTRAKIAEEFPEDKVAIINGEVDISLIHSPVLPVNESAKYLKALFNGQTTNVSLNGEEITDHYLTDLIFFRAVMLFMKTYPSLAKMTDQATAEFLDKRRYAKKFLRELLAGEITIDNNDGRSEADKLDSLAIQFLPKTLTRLIEKIGKLSIVRSIYNQLGEYSDLLVVSKRPFVSGAVFPASERTTRIYWGSSHISFDGSDFYKTIKELAIISGCAPTINTYRSDYSDGYLNVSNLTVVDRQEAKMDDIKAFQKILKYSFS